MLLIVIISNGNIDTTTNNHNNNDNDDNNDNRRQNNPSSDPSSGNQSFPRILRGKTTLEYINWGYLFQCWNSQSNKPNEKGQRESLQHVICVYVSVEIQQNTTLVCEPSGLHLYMNVEIKLPSIEQCWVGVLTRAPRCQIQILRESGAPPLRLISLLRLSLRILFDSSFPRVISYGHENSTP